MVSFMFRPPYPSRLGRWVNPRVGPEAVERRNLICAGNRSPNLFRCYSDELQVSRCFFNDAFSIEGGTRWRRKVAAFSLTYSFRPHYGPGVDSASNRNEYQEYFLEGKGGRCVGLTTLPPSCADCLEIWEPQPPGTLRACPGLSGDCLALLLSKTVRRQMIWVTAE